MAGFSKVCLLLLVATSALGQRAGKNLRGTFPFNSRSNSNAAHAHHGHHEEHHAHHAADDTRDARQRGRGGGDDVALDIGSIAAAGERCIDKVVMVEETEYDDVIECKHSYSQKCHTTYTTDFEPQQEEECEENFIKNCFIDYRKIASEEKIEFCHTPLVCDGEGPVECRTVYESQCATRYHEHTSKMMLFHARLSRRRSARMSLRDTPPRRSVQSGPSRSVSPRRRTSRSTLPRLSVRRSPKSFAAHPAVS